MNFNTKKMPGEPKEFSEWFDGNKIAATGRTRAQFLLAWQLAEQIGYEKGRDDARQEERDE